MPGCSSDDDNEDTPATSAPSPDPAPAPAPDLTTQLRENVKTLVVIFAENRSFNNLLANFPGTGFPSPPNFQVHHQPFNYFKSTTPGTTARTAHIRDAGLGDLVPTKNVPGRLQSRHAAPADVLQAAEQAEHDAGYADRDSGDRHIAHIVDSRRKSKQWGNMVVVITVDENGGWWDNGAPPPPQGDRLGPGSRIPAIVASPFAKKGTVDPAIYDTGPILRLATRLFDLPMLEGLRSRDDAMTGRGQAAMGDLTNALRFNS